MPYFHGTLIRYKGFWSRDPASFVLMCMSVLTSWWVMTCIIKRGGTITLSASSATDLTYETVALILRGLFTTASSCQRRRLSPVAFLWSESLLYFSCQSLDQLGVLHRQERSRGRGIAPLWGDLCSLMKQGELGEGFELDVNTCTFAGRCSVFHPGGPFQTGLQSRPPVG